MDSWPAAELVRRASGGEPGAWREIVRRFERLVWSIARGYRLSAPDAADVVQSTWLNLAEQLTAVRDPERLPAWLSTTTRREALRVATGRRREVPVGEPEMPPDPDTPERLAVLADRDRRLWQAFAELPDRCQALLRPLAENRRLSHAEAAVVLGVEPSSVGRTRARCLAELRRHLTRAGVVP